MAPAWSNPAARAGSERGGLDLHLDFDPAVADHAWSDTLDTLIDVLRTALAR